MKETSIHQHFKDLKDPRVNRTLKHPLINVIFIAFCGILCGAEDWVAIERFGILRKEWFKQFLDMEHDVPSHDTFNRVFAVLDSTQFMSCFMNWVEKLATKLKKTVAIDGKSLRATRSVTQNLGALHVVNVWCCANKLILGQQVVSDKSNEITAIPLLLDLLALEGATITMDAMGCQKEICTKIREKKADYVLSLKGNHGNLHDDVTLYFESFHKGQLSSKAFHHHTIEKNHGRIEERDYWAVPLPDGLRSEGWTDLESIAMVRAQRTLLGETSIEDRYFICSVKAQEITHIAQAIREHWQVESAHWSLDVSFNEDAWCSKLGNAAANASLLNKMALNLLKKETSAKAGIKNKRLMAGWDESYLSKVILGLKN